MPLYHLRCLDQSHHQCEEDILVRLDIVGLSDDQLEAIEQGRTFRVDASQVRASELELDAEQQAFLNEKGYVEYRIDIDVICDTCGTAE